MQKLTKHIAKYAVIEAVAYVIVCPLLFYFTAKSAQLNVALTHFLTLTIASTLFFAYSLVCFAIYRYLWLKGGKGLVGFYLGTKALGMLGAIFALIAYALLADGGIVVFALHIFCIYLVYLVVTTLMYTSTERKLKQQ